MDLIYSTPQDHKLISGVTSIQAQAPDGHIEITPGHAIAFFQLQPGDVSVKTATQTTQLTLTQTSIAHISPDQVTILQSTD